MGTFLLEARQKVTTCLPSSCRSRLKSLSHFKFWFFMVLLLIFIFGAFIFSIFIVINFSSTRGLAKQLQFDVQYKFLKSIKIENKWSELTINKRREAFAKNTIFNSNLGFTHFKMNYSTLCIKREKYLFEFLRLFNVDTWNDDFSANHTLVLGAHTSIGRAIIDALKHKNTSLMSVNSPFWIDFSDSTFRKIMSNIAINRVILCVDMPRYSFADNKEAENKQVTKEEKKFVDSLMNWTVKNNIETYYIGMKKESNMMKLMKDKKAVVFEVPSFIDYNVVNDPNNLFVHSIAEYYKTMKIRDLNGTQVTSLTAREIASSIVSSIEERKKQKIVEKESFTITNFTDILVNSQNYPEFISKAVKHNYDTPNEPYLSIVVVGRHDNFSKGFEERAQNFLDTIAEHSKKLPLANFEIVFVDYGTPRETTTLSKTFKIKEALKGKIRFIVVPVESHVKLTKRMNQTVSFYEYIAKNIGVRRSTGKFILTTNPDDLISIDFFEMIEREELTDGLLYRANRWSCKEDTKNTLSTSQIIEKLQSPWEIKRQNLSSRCPTNIKKTVWFSDSQTLKNEAWSCGAGDFLMLSKEMWRSVQGFNEFPGNANVDALFLGKLMKFVPGYARTIIRSPIVHQYHPRRNIFRPSVKHHEELMIDYACEASCKDLGPYEDAQDWGLADEVFAEESIVL